MEVYDALNGSEQMTPEGLDRMGRLLEGSRIGQARATSPDQYINQVETLARKTYALADTLRRSPGAAQSVGTVAALKESPSRTASWTRCTRCRCRPSPAASSLRPSAMWPGPGAAEASGGLQHTAEEMAAGSTASALASPAVLRAVASTLNLQGTDQMRLLGAASNRGFAQVAVLLSPANATNVAAGLVRGGRMDASRGDRLAGPRTRPAMPCSASIPAARSRACGSIPAARSATTTPSSPSGGPAIASSAPWAVDNTQSVRGGMGVIDQPGAVAGLLYRAFGGDFDRGVQNVALLNSVLGNYSSALAEYGLSSKGSSSSISTVSDTIGGSGSLPFGSKGLPVSGSIEVGGQSETVLNRQSSSDVDAATQLVRRAFDHDLVAARKEADVQQAAYAGRGESFDRNAYIARTIETRLHESFGNLKDAAQLDSGYAVDDSKARAAVEPAGLGTTGEFWNELGGDGLRGTAHGLGVGSQDVASPEHFDAGQERLAPADSGGKVSVEGLPSPQITRPAR